LKKQPTGKALEEWSRRWDDADHTGKLKLCEDYGITYGTARHWRSDSGIPLCPNGKTATSPRSMRVTVDELLAMRPTINLDFVTFDIETSNLKADFSILLSAVIKPFGQDPIVFRADDYPTWENDRANDGAITRDISDELRKHAIVVTHYGDRFDTPYLRAKMMKHGLEPLPQMFGIDTWKIARANFQVSSRRLKNLVRYFDLGEKGQVDGGLWMDAAYNGGREAMDEIVAHNIVDCEVLEKLACVSFRYLRSIPKY